MEGHDEARWKSTKRDVERRDKGIDRLLCIATPQEVFLLRKNAPMPLLKTLDPCHIFPKGAHPDIKYIPENIITLNRYSHNNLDNMKCPITGTSIDYETRQAWWKRLAGKNQWDSLIQILESTSLSQ
jgi:hypothetical protein